MNIDQSGFNVQPLGLVVMSLPLDKEVLGSIHSSAVGFFCSRELYHGMYGLCIPVFHCHFFMFCPMLSSEEHRGI